MFSKLKRGWILRGVCFLIVGCLFILYYLNSFANQPKMRAFPTEEEDSISSQVSLSQMVFGNVLSHSRPAASVKDTHDPRKNLKHKIVHIDLKGMPPLLSYFSELFPFLRKLGVTGVLMEYEDMFPYYGKLKAVTNKAAYNKTEIRFLIKLAKANNLQVIPLVQTFGHLEFILKLENFMGLRERPNYPQVICPTNNYTMELLKEMIDQVMNLHPGIEYLHIGSDEVYYIGQCPLCVDRMNKEKIYTVQLFLQHVRKVAQYVKDTYDVRPIMWDDEFRNLDEDTIVKSGLGLLVDIIVWNYHEDVEKRLSPALWSKYSRIFDSIWIGSAFKGADKPDSIVVNETHYLGNHYSWVNVMREVSHIPFQGIMLTGWQRYDHFSVVCEVLPVAIPSLASCMTYLNTSKYVRMDTIFSNVSAYLDCDIRLNYCHFPGSNVHRTIKQLYVYQLALQKTMKESTFLGWANKYNLRTQFSNPSHVETIQADISTLKSELERLEPILTRSLREVYPDWSVQEWMQTNFYPFYAEVKTIFDGLNKILDHKVFPVRPLKMIEDVSQYILHEN